MLNMFKKHPGGLWVLFLTLLAERAGHYGLRAILVLYLAATAAEGGLAWPQESSTFVYGFYVFMIYTCCIPGGYFSDRQYNLGSKTIKLSKKRMTLAGGLVLLTGHIFMAVPAAWSIYPALALIAIGVGIQKPCATAMLGDLYKLDECSLKTMSAAQRKAAKEENSLLQDQAYALFYMGINTGAMAASIIVPILAVKYGWHTGFGFAGLCAVFSLLIFIGGKKRWLANAGNFVEAESFENSNLYQVERKLSKTETDRLSLIFVVGLVALCFWAAFEQGGGLMSLYTDQYINRTVFGYTIPTGVFQALNPFFVIIFTVVVSNYWIRKAKKGKEASGIFKMSMGTAIMGIGFILMMLAALNVKTDADGNVTQQAGLYWLIGAYWFHTIGELCLSPVAQSYIVKLAPKKYGSLAMGLYFGVTGIGGLIAGLSGVLASSQGHYFVFMTIAVIAIGTGLMGMLFTPSLKRLEHLDEEDSQGEKAEA